MSRICKYVEVDLCKALFCFLCVWGRGVGEDVCMTDFLNLSQYIFNLF